MQASDALCEEPGRLDGCQSVEDPVPCSFLNPYYCDHDDEIAAICCNFCNQSKSLSGQSGN